MKYTLYQTSGGGYMLKRSGFGVDTKYLGEYGIWWTPWKDSHFTHAVAEDVEQLKEWILKTLPTSSEGKLKKLSRFSTLHQVLEYLE